MNQIMVNAVEFDALLKEVEYLKHENQKLEEQLKDAQGRIRVLKEEVGFAERGYTRQALDLQTTIEKGTKAWADVPNASEWVEELRGNDTPEVTPEVNEPEGWVKIDEVRQYFDSVNCGTIYKTAGEGRVPLYLAPPKREWVGLTEEDFYKKDDETVFVLGMKFAEARLKEKNA